MTLAIKLMVNVIKGEITKEICLRYWVLQFFAKGTIHPDNSGCSKPKRQLH
jgi:hypothetical protein